ncbi:MAG TPA: isocitrate/isopropylmalate family dehydrogenase [Gaiellaceae bacterium]|nr:isocitrate/isopropylmalate family dehydrogenase [Gaiellaceae bacterium]
MKTVACLTGSGTAPELMAEAMYALDAVARVHGFAFDQVHAPFGGVALARLGQTVPPSTRNTVLGSDAVLVAGAEEPALDDVMAELDLRARVTRVRFGQADDVAFVTAVRENTAEWTVRRAFDLAETRRMRLTCVGDNDWCELVNLAAPDHEHVRVEHVSPRDAMPFAAFNPARFDVVAVAPQWAEGMVEISAAAATHRVAAHALLSEHGPSLFVPSPDGGFALAGHGVVNPSSMLLAAALTLEHGLGQPAAAETLAGAVSRALADEPVRFGVRASTREFTSRVLAGFQLSMRAEFA